MRNIRSILLCIALFLIGFVTIVTTYSWFTNSYEYQNNILGRTRISYFAGGDGSSIDPFIISEPEHMFNLSALNELGFFDGQAYYFKLADLNGNPTVIDFSDSSVPEVYRIIKPVGDHIYPFKGIFIGNNSIIKSLTVDGEGKQDIGVFGYVTTGSEISSFFIQDLVLLSNPSTTDDKTGFHPHINEIMSRATGYIVGHLGTGAVLNNVFVIEPTINSLSNGDINRSQYGLIGFNEAEGGIIPGSPRNSYNFTMDGVSAYAAITRAQTTYANYYINGSSTLRLSNAISSGQINAGYSLSTLRISTIPNDPDPVYLYDQLVADGFAIGANGSQYSRENIDVVGVVGFSSTTYQIFANLSAFTTPTVGSVFNPTTRADALFLYVRPTNNPQDLGNVVGTYTNSGGDLAYLSGYDVNGNYVPNRVYQNKTSPGVVNFGASGVTQTMIASNAWAAVVEEIDPNTNERILRVVDETVIPDFYVYLLAVTNGQANFTRIAFEYLPQGIAEEDFEMVSAIDFIHVDQIPLIINDILNYEFSLLYYNYEIINGQSLGIFTERLSNGGYNIYIDYSIIDSSFFYFDIINVRNKTLTLYVNDVLVNTYTNTIVAIRFLNNTYEITPT